MSCLQGMQCHGVPEYVIVNGRVCVDDQQLKVVEGYGRFIETPVYPPFVYSPDKMKELKPELNGTSTPEPVQQMHKVVIKYDFNIITYNSNRGSSMFYQIVVVGQIDLNCDFQLRIEEERMCATPTLPESAVSTPSIRGARPDGQRNIQESTFSVSGKNITTFIYL